MHHAAKNLLYIFHRSLTARHATVNFFLCYAQSPENRTFKNYFRRPRAIFATYMRKRDQFALARYISLHRRRKNPILINFATHITDFIMEKLQQPRPLVIPPNTEDGRLWTKKTQNKPILQTQQNGASRFLNKTNAYCLTPVACKNKPKTKPFVGLARNFQQRSAKIKPATAEGAFAGFTHGSLRPFNYVPIRHPFKPVFLTNIKILAFLR